MTIHENLQAAGRPRAIAGHAHVCPGPDREWLSSSHTDRIARPKMDQRPSQVTAIDEQFVAPAGGVGPGLRAMEHNRSLVGLSRPDPGCHAERLAAAKVAHRRGDRVVAGQPQDHPIPTLHERVLRGRGRCPVGGRLSLLAIFWWRLCRRQRVRQRGKLAILAFLVKGIVNEFTGDARCELIPQGGRQSLASSQVRCDTSADLVADRRQLRLRHGHAGCRCSPCRHRRLIEQWHLGGRR